MRRPPAGVRTGRPSGTGFELTWGSDVDGGVRGGRGKRIEFGEVGPMEFQDKTLSCIDCGTEFIWTAGEQLFFADKNFKNEPKRCKSCKAKRASRPASGAVMARERVETTTNCSACGKETTVPFRPTQGRPVFCRECFQQRKFAGV
ncbi:MAG TPA: zinc-ribbon domain containing protein [Vicinamibacterales bacterium]|nr:zinc-ribbon domain containing protein [Vicinamibacterales bacterium]